MNSSFISARNCFPGPNIGEILCLLKEGYRGVSCDILSFFHGYKIFARRKRHLAVRIQINEKALRTVYEVRNVYRI
jgi:hypothetical protein